MLPPGFLGSVIFDLTKKVRKDGKKLGLTYFLLNIGLTVLFVMVVGLLISLGDIIRGSVNGRFFLWLFIAGIVIGALHAGVTWLLWFRKEK